MADGTAAGATKTLAGSRSPAPVDLDEVRRLNAAATDGPWAVEWELHDLSVRAGDARSRWNKDHTVYRPSPCYAATDVIFEHYTEGDPLDPGADDVQREADAHFIAASRTVVPVFLDVVDSVLALHKRVFPVFPSVSWEASGKYPMCEECHSAYPCANVQIVTARTTTTTPQEQQ